MRKSKIQTVQLNDSGSPETEVMVLGDRHTISSSRVLRDTGEMFAPVTIARAGVMLYKAKELGGLFDDRKPDDIIRVMTKPEVLFDAATIEACRSIPLTIEHPADDVNITNNKELQKGFLEGLPHPDGSALAGHVVINDSAALRLVDSGVDQISLGHKSRLLRVDDNDEYDCEKLTIVPNHIAIVRRGRAQTTRIGDSGEEIAIVDKAVFDQVEAERDVLVDKVNKLEVALADADKNKISDEDMCKLVEEKAKSRVNLLAQVAVLSDSININDLADKSDVEIKRMVVSNLTDKDLEDKSDDYIGLRFELLLEDTEGVNLSDALSISLLDSKKDEEEQKQKKPSVREEALARRNERYKK